VIDESFQRFPGLGQSDFAIVDYIAVLIARILFLARLKCEGSVNQVEIQVLELESFEARFESWLDALGPVVGVPQLGGDENVFARDVCGG